MPYHRFAREMTSEKRRKKFHTDDESLPSLPADVRWGSFVTHSFLPHVTNEPQRTSAGRLITTRKQISHTARPIRITTHIWVVSRHQYGIAALVSQGASRNVGCFLRLVFSQLNTLKVLVYLFERGGLSNPIKWFTFHLCSERGITESPVKEPCRGAGQSEEPSPYYS